MEAADKQTSDLFLKAPRNASYLNRRVQNQIISLMGDAIQKQILSDISQCKYFSILADVTTDVSQTEQLSLSVRFIKDSKVHEESLCFVPVSSTTGKDLASMILTQLSQLGLNLVVVNCNPNKLYHGLQWKLGHSNLFWRSQGKGLCRLLTTKQGSVSKILMCVWNCLLCVVNLCVVYFMDNIRPGVETRIK